VKATAECVYIAPAPPRRRKGPEAQSKEDLQQRLRRYEDLLRQYGATEEEIKGTSSKSSSKKAPPIAPTEGMAKLSVTDMPLAVQQ
jgi:hypothetical protein